MEDHQSSRWTPSRIALTGLLYAILGVALVAMIFVAIGNFGSTEQKILVTPATLAAMAFLGLPGVWAIERNVRYLAWSGVLATTSLGILLLTLIWGGDEIASEGFGKTTGIIATLAVGLNIGALMNRMQARARVPRILQRVSYMLTTLSSLAIIIAILAEISAGDYWRCVGAMFIGLVATTVAAPVANRLRNLRSHPSPVDTPQGPL